MSTETKNRADAQSPPAGSQEGNLLFLSALYLFLAGLLLAALFVVSRSHFLLFHSLAELFSIAVAWSVFLLVWNGRRYIANDALVFLGIVFLFVGGIDLVHTLAYKGMGIIPAIDEANAATQLWIGARWLEALGLLLFTLLLGRRFNPYVSLAGAAAVMALLLAAIFLWSVFPTCYVEGSGLTPFKKGSEYAICLVLLAAMALLSRRRERLDAVIYRLILLSIGATIAAELAFTFYVSVYGLSNVVGHFLKIASFFFTYMALIHSGLNRPYALLFRELEESRRELRRAHQVSQLGHWDWDLESGQIRWSEEMYRFYGMVPDAQPSVARVRELVHPEDRPQFDAAMRALEEGSELPDSIEYRITLPDGKERWLESRAVAERDADGKPVHLFGTIMDISERRVNEQKLHIEQTLREIQLRLSLTVSQQDHGETFVPLLEVLKEGLDRLGIPFHILGVNLVDAAASPVRVEVNNMHWDESWQPPCSPREPELIERLWREGKIAYRRDLMVEDPYGERGRVAVCCGRPVRSIIDIPFAFGTLAANSLEAEAFGDRDVDLLKQLAVYLEETFRRYRERLQLAESERRWQILMDNLPGMAYRCGDAPGWPMELVSQGALMLTGYTPDELAGDGPPLYGDLIHPEDQLKVEEKVRASIASGRPFELEYRLVARDGSVKWGWERGQSVPGGNPEKGTLEGFIADISERHQAEIDLRDLDVRYQAMLDHSPLLMSVVGCDGRYLKVNRTLGAFFGRRPEELEGKRFDELLPEEIAATFSNRLEQVCRDRSPLTVEDRIAVDGTESLYITTLFPLQPPSEPLREVGIVSYEITEQEKVRENLRRLSAAVEQAGEMVVITDTDGIIQYVNPAFEGVTGYTGSEAIGQNVEMLRSDRHDEEFHRAMWASLQAGQIWEGHFTNRRKDGTLFVEEATISPVRNAAGEVVNYVAVKRDVTREREMEDQFRQAQKMEAVGSLAGGVAHDMNNLLSPILLGSELLLQELVPGDERRDMVEEIKGAGMRARDLVRQLLLFSRREPLEVKTIDLNKVIAGFEKLLRRTLRENVEIEIDLAPSSMPVRADVGQMEQVLMNLAANAQDAMPDGGRISIGTSTCVLGEAEATAFPSLPPGRYVRLTVADDGHGMDAETLERIFEPFFTTKGQGKGTGLGLATVYAIADQHGGGVRVDSHPGRGTTFSLCFPLADTDAEEEETSPLRTDEIGGRTVLLVEDEAGVRKHVSQALRENGFEVLAASRAGEALRLANAHRGRLDLLLTDVILPERNGRQLATQISVQQPEIKVLYMSGYPADVIDRHGVLEKGIAFLQKPFTHQELMRKVSEVLQE